MFLTQVKSNGIDKENVLQEIVSENGSADQSASIEIVNRFAASLCSREAAIRSSVLEAMEKSIFQWMEGSEDLDDSKVSNGSVTNGNNAHVDYRSMIIMHIPALLRLSVSCPFRDVREKCQHVINNIREKAGIPIPFHHSSIGASFFIPSEDLPNVGSPDEKPHSLFIDAFLQNSRLDHVTQVMGHHITYLDIFLRTQNFILRGDGPLPYDYRHFIAIMAAGRHQCSYLINLQRQEFILQGGDQAWLKGLAKIPKKLRDLYEINKILAHRPWLLNEKHIEKLTKGTDSWSLAEVVHAIVLLTHFHSLSSFVFGCGVNDELDHHNEHHHHYNHHHHHHANTLPAGAKQTTIPSPPKAAAIIDSKGSGVRPEAWLGGVAGGGVSDEAETDCNVGVDTLMQRMKSLSERSEQFSAEERAKRFEHVESQSVQLLTRSSVRLKPSIGHFIDDPDFVYEDFARRGESSDIPTFRVHDYSWDDHGYSLVNRLYNDVGNLLDEKFKTAYNLTYYTMGGRMGVDTSRFRRAIWNYIQCMFGIRHDDYDYGEVNQLLERSLKAFIKSACCFPERVAKSDYDRVLREFKHSEKVHVNLMILEARMQAELLYALRAVMRYMT